MEKLKILFKRLICKRQQISNELYQHLCENNIPDINLNVQPLSSVSNPDDTKNDNVNITTINEEHNLKMRQGAHLLRDILPPDVSEAVIYDLLQQYNTVEIAINAYYEREITENQERV